MCKAVRGQGQAPASSDACVAWRNEGGQGRKANRRLAVRAGKRGHRSRLFVTPDLGQLRNKLLVSFFGPGPGGPSPYIALPANSHAGLAMLSPFWRFGNDDGAPTRWSIGNLTDPATVAHASKPRCMALLRSACFTLFARRRLRQRPHLQRERPITCFR